MRERTGRVCTVGYSEYQFTGVVRRVRLNGQLLKLSDLPTNGQVEVVPCSSSEVKDFVDEMKVQHEQHSYPLT